MGRKEDDEGRSECGIEESVENELEKGYLGYEESELVSSDFKGDPRSSIVDAPMTLVVGGDYCSK